MSAKSLLPYSMQDESNLAIEKCINSAFDIDMTKFLLCIPENLSESVLLARANMLHVMGLEGWNECQSREERENLLKNAIKNHRNKGTLSSIKNNLSNIEFEYLNWYEYNGLPNHFKFKMYQEKTLTIDLKNKISQTISEYKRLSSKNDGIEIYITIQDTMDLLSTVIQARKVLIK
jgi:P2-related tail formation protein